MPKTPSALEILEGLGYDPVDIESDADYIRALKESYNKLQIQNPSDPRLEPLADAVKGYRKSKREQPKLSTDKVKEQIDAKEKKKKDAMNFISPGSKPPELPPAESNGGGDMSSSLMKISNDVNIIKGIVESQEKLEKDKIEDTREAREKKKRSMAENLMEGGKKMYDKVAGAFGKVLEPAKGIFQSIFDFLKLFILGTGLMKLLDWMGDSKNKSKIQSIFRFLKDFWPVIAAGVIALMGPIPTFIAAIALAFGFVPKIIDFVKSIFGLNKDVDKEIKKEEKDYEKNTKGTAFDTDTEEKEQQVKPEETPPEQQDAEKMNKGGMVPDRGNVTKMNKGGEVPGQGNTDTVPAMLTPGEFVLTKEAVNQVGADTLYGLNAAAGGVGKSNDVPRGPSGKPIKKTMKKKSTVQTMMDNGGLNTINNISKSMSNVTNNTSKPMSNVTNNSSKSMSNITNNSSNDVTNNSSNDVTNNSSNDVTNNSMNMSDVTNKSSSDVTNNKSNLTNNIFKTMNMSGGGMTKNTSYMNRGGLVNNNISYMNKGGLVNNTSHMNRGGMTKNISYMGDGGMTKNISYMGDGGMTKNSSYMGGGLVNNTSYMNRGGMTKNTSYMNRGGLVNNNISYMNKGGLVTNNVGGTSNVQHMKLGGMIKNFISNSPQARFLKFAGNQISKTPQARLLRFAAKQIKKLPVKPPAAKALNALKALGMKNTPPPPMAPEGGDTSVNEIPRFSVIASGGRAKEQTLGIRR